ncbi:DUF6880 family protein [Vibrio mediterranei]
MSVTLTKKLQKFDKDALVDLLVEIHNENRDCKKVVTTLMAMHDPKAMYKALNKEVSAIKRGTKFIDYREAGSFCDILYAISEKTEKYLATQAPDLAVKLCQSLIDMDSKLAERVDDSHGDLGGFYCQLFDVLDKALPLSSLSPSTIVDDITRIYSHDDYGYRRAIIDKLNHVLTPEVIEQFKQQLPEPSADILSRRDRKVEWKTFQTHVIQLSIHKKIADKEKNIDRYIHLCQLTGIDDKNRCDIASRLNHQFQSEQAIEWLEGIPETSMQILDKYSLLQEAYQLEGDKDKEKTLIWTRFERLMNSKDYFAYLSFTSGNETQKIKEKVYHMAANADSIETGLAFFQDVGEIDAIETLFLSRLKEVNAFDYSFYRKLSTYLSKNEKPLAAVLMRRLLVNQVLDSARSKHYRYAISDLSQAEKFSVLVTNWGNHLTHQDYLTFLKEQHSRKYSFWEQWQYR